MKSFLRLPAVFLAALTLAHAEAPAKVACVGDSITAGVGSKGPGTYPNQLATLLGSAYQVRNFGNSGSTLLRVGDKPYDKQKSYQQMLDFKADIYVIILGTNDSKPQNWAKKQDFKPSAFALIDAIRQANSAAKIYTCLPIPAFPANFGITDEVIKTGVIPQLKEIAAEKKTQVIDLYSVMSGKGNLVPDHVHPNAEGYRLMAAAVYKALTGKDADLSKLAPPPGK